jgi:hypothetical protein
MQGMAQAMALTPPITNRWSPNPEHWPIQMQRDYARWQV